ncbi:MAG: aldo/keto reductase [Bacillota bacterium]|nr:aldo/keto reductase [Bacillota bacterium]
MQYRKFGKCDFEISSLGFGCMRLPILNGKSGDIDEPQAIGLIRHAIDRGVNYVDTAYPYHDYQSEVLVGKALKDGYREKVKLATKMPVWLVKEYSDFDKYLNEQLKKLDVEYIDMYLLHALDKNRIDELEKIGIYKFLDEALKDGRIKYAGFSFHDDVNTFKRIVDAYNWSFCQIQYNFMDENYQAGKEGLEYAASKGLAVVIMEPLKGGKLAKNPPNEVQAIYNTAVNKKSPANWALSWVWNHPEVTLLLSGMNSMEQVDENIDTASKALPNSFITEEVEVMDKVKAKYKELLKIGCTACEYCLPCPAGVNIPHNFSLYNEVYMYNDLAGAKGTYNHWIDPKSRASSCVECGKCEKACPQHLSIRALLKDVHTTLGQ